MMDTNPSPKAPCHDGFFWQAFDGEMQARGWRKQLLLMRGVKWTKDDDDIIYDSLGWQLNGRSLSEDDLFQFLNIAP